MKLKVYLAGQWNQYSNNWKEQLKPLSQFDFYDPEVNSNQSSPDTYFPDDLQAIKEADILIANPGLAPSEGAWIEVGYFYATHTLKPGESCPKLIIIYPEDRLPKWSFDFVAKTGIIVSTVDEAKQKLLSNFS